MKSLLSALAAACLAAGQNAAQSGGVDTEWDLRKLLDTLTASVQRLQPIVEQADPGKWSDASIAQSYSSQWKTAISEIQYLASSTKAFAKQPERLTLALDSYFRLQALEVTLGSFIEGARRHGNPAVADLIEATMRENSANREHLRGYVTELAQTKEEEFKVMDQEAQRCRATVSRPQTPRRSPTPSKPPR